MKTKHIRKISVLVFLLFAGLCVTSCTDGKNATAADSIEGTWSGGIGTIGPFHFSDSGTVTAVLHRKGNMISGNMRIDILKPWFPLGGNYTLQGVITNDGITFCATGSNGNIDTITWKTSLPKRTAKERGISLPWKRKDIVLRMMGECDIKYTAKYTARDEFSKYLMETILKVKGKEPLKLSTPKFSIYLDKQETQVER